MSWFPLLLRLITPLKCTFDLRYFKSPLMIGLHFSYEPDTESEIVIWRKRGDILLKLACSLKIHGCCHKACVLLQQNMVKQRPSACLYSEEMSPFDFVYCLRTKSSRVCCFALMGCIKRKKKY